MAQLEELSVSLKADASEMIGELETVTAKVEELIAKIKELKEIGAALFGNPS